MLEDLYLYFLNLFLVFNTFFSLNTQFSWNSAVIPLLGNEARSG